MVNGLGDKMEASFVQIKNCFKNIKKYLNILLLRLGRIFLKVEIF
jgi:hypothetical protein